MKRFLLACLIALSGVLSSPAVRYQGFVEGCAGVYTPSKILKSGPEIGFSTSHGLEINPGLFVGVGADIMFGFYEDPQREPIYGTSPSDAYINSFVEGRYRILPLKKISPFVGLRFGAGYGNCYNADTVCPYISPAVGGSFNFTRKFGMDISLGYVFHGTIDYIHYVNPLDEHAVIDKIANNSIQLRIGIHF